MIKTSARIFDNEISLRCVAKVLAAGGFGLISCARNCTSAKFGAHDAKPTRRALEYQFCEMKVHEPKRVLSQIKLHHKSINLLIN